MDAQDLVEKAHTHLKSAHTDLEAAEECLEDAKRFGVSSKTLQSKTLQNIEKCRQFAAAGKGAAEKILEGMSSE